MGKLLEDLILQILQSHREGENILSVNQFGFRKARSTVDTIRAVVDIDTNARRGTGKRKGFCALVSIDIRNAFNHARWKNCFEAMIRKKIPDNLLRMINDYQSNRWAIYEGDKWSFKAEMTRGALQGSLVGTSISFVDNALIVCAADDVGILELRINKSLRRAKRWLDSRSLEMTLEKTETLLVRDRRSFRYPKIVLGEHDVTWSSRIKYLSVQLDRRLNFSE